MQAWVAIGYKGPDVLALRHLPLPRIGAHDVLIRVEATTVSAGDRRLRASDFPTGMGLLGRAFCGVTRLRRPVLGTELTGIVAAIGSAVARFVPGDAVIAFPGAAVGGHAEYCRFSETGMIVPRPAGLPIETAAALGFGGTTAMDYLRRANCKAGERVLVVGVSGTVGSARSNWLRRLGQESAQSRAAATRCWSVPLEPQRPSTMRFAMSPPSWRAGTLWPMLWAR